MITPKTLRKNRIRKVCGNTGDIPREARLLSVQLADQNCLMPFPADTAVICCGRIGDEEALFRTADGQYYFTVLEGWGEKNGSLFGIRIGWIHDFKHPTTVPEALALCRNNPSDYCSYAGMLAYRDRKYKFGEILKVLEAPAK